MTSKSGESIYEAHVDAVIHNYNEKIRDLALLYHAERELKLLGLAEHLID